MVPKGVPVQPPKIKYVKNLLKIPFGEEWTKNPSAQYLKNVLPTLEERLTDNNPEEGTYCCDVEEVTDMIVLIKNNKLFLIISSVPPFDEQVLCL